MNVAALVTSSDHPTDSTDIPAVSDHGLRVPRPHESAVPSATANEGELDRKSIVSTAAGLLHIVRDFADAFGPLKSVAGGLCFILENCEVLSSSHVHAQR